MCPWGRFKGFWNTKAERQLSHSTTSQQDFNNKTFRITHPFHPYRNIEFEIDHVKRIAYESRVFFFNTKGRKSSVPLYWTDISPENPFVAVSAGRSFFRVEDLRVRRLTTIICGNVDFVLF